MADDKVTLKSDGGVDVSLIWEADACVLRVGDMEATFANGGKALLHELALGKPSARPVFLPGPTFARGQAIAAAANRMKVEQLHQAKEQAKKDYEHLLAFIDRQIAAKTPSDQLALPSGSGEG